MKKIFLSVLVVVVALFYNSCSNDFEVNSDYTDNTTVYGLLNPADTIQYIRIGKAFLGEISAYEMAAEYDSLYYSVSKITVNIQRYLNGSPVGQPYILSYDTLKPKNEGIFSAPKQLLYRTNMPVLQDGSTYKLNILNSESGKIITSQTVIIGPISVTVPLQNQGINLVAISPFKTKYKTAKNGRLYNFTLRFKYREQFIFDTTQVANKYIDMVYGNSRSGSLDGGEEFSVTIEPTTFFNSIANKIAVNNNVIRRFSSLEFRYSAAAEEFTTYMDVSQSQQAVFGANPVYTNIGGGIGLFSSRLNHSVMGVMLNAVSMDSLRNGSITSQLNFQ